VSGQDRKFPPAPGTNQIAGFREFRPLTSQEKNNCKFSFLVSRLYCQMLSNILTAWYSKYSLREVWHRHCRPGKFSLSKISQNFLVHLKLRQIFSTFCQGISGKRFIQLCDVRNCGRFQTTVSYWQEEVKPTTSSKLIRKCR